MGSPVFTHQLSDFRDLILATAKAREIEFPQLVEKDYWIMHCLWGLQVAGYLFHLKGGTSLSKGFGLLGRFSEDIDILIEPPAGIEVHTGKNQNKPSHVKSRKDYYDYLASEISIEGTTAERDQEFDDPERYRSGGIRLHHDKLFGSMPGLKDGVLLEAGFAQVAPSEPKTISSWAYEHAVASGMPIIDNRAIDVPCYEPGYTLVEKLQAVAKKYRQYKSGEAQPKNFMRHYYDIHCLLVDPAVRQFTQSEGFDEHVKATFSDTELETPMNENQAFLLDDEADFGQFKSEYESKADLYYLGQPDFGEIIGTIRDWLAEKYRG